LVKQASECSQHSICPCKGKENIGNFMDFLRPSFGEKILLMGDVSYYGKYLKKAGADVTIFEHAENFNNSAVIKNSNCSIVDGLPEYMPFKDSCFDKVVFLNHFNSFDDEKKVLKEVDRVLKLHGDIIIEEVNPKGIIRKISIIFMKLLGFQCKYYAPCEILRLFKGLGYSGEINDVENKKFIYVGKKLN